MKILVTGATGFLGRNFLDFIETLQTPIEVVCLIRTLEKGGAIQQQYPSIVLLPGDLLNPASLQSLPSDFDIVFHIAAMVGLKNGPAFYEVNVGSTRNLVNALQNQKHLKRIVQISSIAAVDRTPESKLPYAPLTESVLPHPRTDYGKSKLQAEQLIIESGLPYTVLRPAYIYGPHARPGSSMDRVMHDVWQGCSYTRIPFPGYASEIFALDLAEIMWLVSQTPQCENQVYFVSNPQPLAIKQFFKTLAAQLGLSYRPYPIPKVLMSPVKMYLIWRRLEPILAEILFHEYFACDPSKLFSHLSYQPRHGFESGLSQTITWYRQQGKLTT